MNERIQAVVGVAILVALGVTVIAWGNFLVRWRRTGRFPLAFRAWRPVPWTITPAMGLLLVGLILPSALTGGFQPFLEDTTEVPANSALGGETVTTEQIATEPIATETTATETTATQRAEETTRVRERGSAKDHGYREDSGDKNSSKTDRIANHPALEAIGRGAGMTPAIFFSAVFVAPAYEETLFRLLLLGGLEATLFQLARRRRWTLRGVYTYGVPAAILLVGGVFAALHIRPAQTTDVSPIFLSWKLLLVQGTSQILVGVWILGMLRFLYGAKWTDFGLDPGPGGRFWRQDLRTGFTAAALTIIPLFIVQAMVGILFRIFHSPIAPDPVAILLLAVVLGGIYIRTRRLLPCVVLHFCLNAISTTLKLAQSFSL